MAGRAVAQTNASLQKRQSIAVIRALAAEQLQHIAGAHGSSMAIGKVTSHADHKSREKAPDAQMGKLWRLFLHVRQFFRLLVLVAFGRVAGQRG